MIDSLVERCRSLLGRSGKQQSRVDAALNRTYLELYQAQRKHFFVEVRVDGDDVLYQSMILELDPEEKTILVDELFPKGFVGLPGQRVHIGIRQPGGRKIKFSTTILEQHSYDESPVYVLAMPRNLDGDQRRDAYRLPVGGVEICPQFVGPDRRSYLARLCNLSSRGVGMELDIDDPEHFRYNDPLSHVAFEFAGISFDCEMAVRNVALTGPDQNKVWIGAEFLDLPPLDQRVLEKSIMRIQRDRIRQGAEVESQLAMA